MANQIQATIYQTGTTMQIEPVIMAFSTQNIIVREATLQNEPNVQSCIIYYQSPSNPPTEYYVSENFNELTDNANVGEVALVTANIASSGLPFGFPSQNISILGVNGGIAGANSCIQYKGVNYYVTQTEAELYAQANTQSSTYKVYTALLTQSGDATITTINSGDLEIGRTYTIPVSEAIPPFTWDFTNVGAPNNDSGTTFVATGTTPIWGNGELSYVEGNPVVTILENTIGNVWFEYVNKGIYKLKSTDNIYIENKFAAIQGAGNASTLASIWVYNSAQPLTELTIEVYDLGNIGAETYSGFLLKDDILVNQLLEIRVYN